MHLSKSRLKPVIGLGFALLLLPSPLASMSSGADAFKPVVVVAILDSSANPWHVDFREKAFSGAPADYIPGYPADAVAVPLTLNASSWQEAFDADRATLLETVTTGRLVHFPGTKFVGAISFRPWSATEPLLVSEMPGRPPPYVYGAPEFVHGVMTSSRLAGNDISLAGPDVRLVFIQASGVERAQALDWAAQQPWIDIISMSSTSPAGVAPAPAALDAPLAAAVEAASHAKPLFLSAGNGWGGVGLIGYPGWFRGVSGAPDAISVGANDNGETALWSNTEPYVVTDGCGAPAALHRSLDGFADYALGTSSAAPFAAGGGAKILMEARRLLRDDSVGARDGPAGTPGAWESGWAGDGTRVLAQGKAGRVPAGPLADGVFTMRDFKDVLYHAAVAGGSVDASDGAACAVFWQGTPGPADLPDAARSTFEGYGEVNARSVDLAGRILQGAVALPARADADEAYARAHALRVATWGLPGAAG